ncbi:MAG: prolyl oligopeptidase family serine peptidase [Alphaproteobacteria bacterium]|nr:prolyl oligopeptidase family serine peptidase [Alphaproteobacteria bacterium]
MIDFFRPTNPFAAQTERLVAEAQQGGGDLFDIERVCRELEPGDAVAWEAAWRDLAEKTEARASAALASGNDTTARGHYFAANQYYRQSEIFMPPGDPRKAERFVLAQRNFRSGAALQSPAIECIRVNCGDESYDGYFCHPREPRAEPYPAVFLIGGADAYAEEIYFSGRQIVERGWALLLVDTPGRGSSLYLNGIPARPDYEVPVAACLDYLSARPEVDADRLALMGISMAGYYAPRAAAFEDRLKALVSWCGCYSILDDLYDFFPLLQPTLQRLVGAETDADAREKLAAFSMAGIAGNISCPTLVTHGVNDLLMNVEGAKRLFAEIGAADKTLKIWDGPEGGTGHCNYDNWSISIPFMLDWLEERITAP